MYWIIESGKKRPAIKVSCTFCNKKILRRKFKTSKKRFCRPFCSKKCQFASRYNKVDVTCFICNKSLKRRPDHVKNNKSNQFFCSNKCHTLAQTKELKFCLVCNKKINQRSRFCSQAHRRDYRLNEWLDGAWNGCTINMELSKTIRKFLIEEAGNKCSQCNWDKINPVTGKRPLMIDHIDGNFSNQSRSNLRVLCPCCHSLTPNFGALNRGNGRNIRKKHSLFN